MTGIKASELRLGNWVYFTIEETETVQINIGQLVYSLKQPESIYGIPLTEEWLARFGFVKTEQRPYQYCSGIASVDFYKLNGFILSKSLNKKSFIFCYEQGYIAEFQFVHQLQNLYFALTNTELEIDENR